MGPDTNTQSTFERSQNKLEICIRSVEPRPVDAALVFGCQWPSHDTDDLAIADPGSYSTKVANVLRRLAIDVYGVFPLLRCW